MKRWSKGKIIVEVLMIAATGVCAYFGILMLSRAHRGTPRTAKIVSCHVPDTENNDGHELCTGQWTVGDAAHRRTVTGTVEDATSHDEGKTMEIVVVGGHGFKKGGATRLGIVFLVFAAIFLGIAALLPRG